MDAGGAVERIHLQTGIVGEQITFGVAAVGQGFLDGVGFEGVASFLGCGDGFRQRSHVEIGSGQLELAKFAGITGGAIDDHAPSRDFCTTISSAMPTRASAISEPSCESSKAVFSAVACNSTNWPVPVITTFISTSACESSW